jgi:hypothetical protein
MKSPIQIAIENVSRMGENPVYDLEPLKNLLKDLLQDEREEFAKAWVDGNRRGWDMTSDWEEHGDLYYNNRFNNEKSDHFIPESIT